MKTLLIILLAAFAATILVFAVLVIRDVAGLQRKKRHEELLANANENQKDRQ